MSATEIQAVLSEHKKWLSGEGGNRANLRDLNLWGANFSGVNLWGANLSGADLSNANLSNANLSGANLENTHLRDANLSGTDLRGANLRGADLIDTNLRDANLRHADLRHANLRNADLRGAQLPVKLVVPGLDQKMLEACEVDGALNMFTWHTCETMHCRAGWAVTLAGEAGRVLEGLTDTATAAALIYASTYPDRKIPDFYGDNDETMQDIRRCAALTST